MPDSQSIHAERGMQPRFSKASSLLILLAPLCILLFAWLLETWPDREELGPRIAQVRFEPVRLQTDRLAPLRLAGAWKLTSDDSRFGGISALSVQPDGLIALSDSGALVRFARPAGGKAAALIDELPDGPAGPDYKLNRDTEALLADPQGRGWWVPFEVHHEIWLYDPKFERALRRIRFGRHRWSRNSGIEALAAMGPDLLLFPEGGGRVLQVRGSQALRLPLVGQSVPISAAAVLPDGNLLLLERRMSWRGFANALVALDREGGRYRAVRRFELPLGPLDNAEALAAEPLPGGAVRLWLMTDDNFQPPFRTLLLALDMPLRSTTGR